MHTRSGTRKHLNNAKDAEGHSDMKLFLFIKDHVSQADHWRIGMLCMLIPMKTKMRDHYLHYRRNLANLSLSQIRISFPPLVLRMKISYQSMILSQMHLVILTKRANSQTKPCHMQTREYQLRRNRLKNISLLLILEHLQGNRYLRCQAPTQMERKL